MSNQLINKSAKQLIKLTSKGKVSISMSASLKPFFLTFIETVQQRNELFNALKLEEETAIERMRLALVCEVYMRHLVNLSMINQPGRLLLTLAQAHALWTYWMDYYNEFSKHPEMGNLFMQLHQKLS